MTTRNQIVRRGKLISLPLLVLTLSLLPALGGCSSGYTLSGRVIEGEFSQIQFVDKNDPRLMEGNGLDGAMIMVFREPSSLGRTLTARSSSDGSGAFECHIGEFGTGWLVEDWDITVSRPAYANATRLGQLPRNKKDLKMLVVLARGASTPVPTGSEYEQDLDRFGGGN